jgi:hypothetical protein
MVVMVMVVVCVVVAVCRRGVALRGVGFNPFGKRIQDRIV